MSKAGDRVGSIRNTDKETVYLYGYGVYSGDIEHPTLGVPNPQILLDSGEIVWGCECWWGPEDSIKAAIGNRKIVTVKVHE